MLTKMPKVYNTEFNIFFTEGLKTELVGDDEFIATSNSIRVYTVPGNNQQIYALRAGFKPSRPCSVKPGNRDEIIYPWVKLWGPYLNVLFTK